MPKSNMCSPQGAEIRQCALYILAAAYGDRPFTTKDAEDVMQKGRFWFEQPRHVFENTDTFPVRIWSSDSRKTSLTRTLLEEAKKQKKGVFVAHCPVAGPYKINLEALDVLLKKSKNVTFPDMKTWKAQYLAHIKTSGTPPLLIAIKYSLTGNQNWEKQRQQL